MFRVSCIQLCSGNNVRYNLKKKQKKFFLKAIQQKTDFILTPEVSSKISLDKKITERSNDYGKRFLFK